MLKRERMKNMKLMRGINLGGYLSQCCHTEEHYHSFIQKENIKQIADWGFDHVRIPIDYVVLEDENGIVKETGYEIVRQVLDWCRECGIDAILDLHKAYGYDFNDAGDNEKNHLFSSEEIQQRFVKLWIRIANQFGSCEHVAFELLNEVVEEENAQAWNRLIKRTVIEIRKITKTTPIIYGGIQWNSVKTLKLLEAPYDNNIIFTFHFYEPLLFTHQKASWVTNMDPDKEIPYPESMDYYCRHSEELGHQGKVVTTAKSTTMGPEFICEMIKEATDVSEEIGVRLYCGEFGVIDRAPVEDTYRWFADVDKVFKENQIGCAVWTYKEKDFGLIGEHYDSIRESVLSLWLN